MEEFFKLLSSSSSTSLNTNVDINIIKSFDAVFNLESIIDVDDNLTAVVFDAEAVGPNSVVEADISVLTLDNTLSSASGTIIAATSSGDDVPNLICDPVEFFIEFDDTVTVDVLAANPAFAFDPTTLAVDQTTAFPGSTTSVAAGQLGYTAADIDPGGFIPGNQSQTDEIRYSAFSAETGMIEECVAIARLISPLRQTDTETDEGELDQTITVSLATEQRTFNTTSFVEIDIVFTGDEPVELLDFSLEIDGVEIPDQPILIPTADGFEFAEAAFLTGLDNTNGAETTVTARAFFDTNGDGIADRDVVVDTNIFGTDGSGITFAPDPDPLVA